jgi:lipoprotein-anchoring transpeptidase ErfK/SrfK
MFARRSFLRLLAIGLCVAPVEAQAASIFGKHPVQKSLKKHRKTDATLKRQAKPAKIRKPAYSGFTVVDFSTPEKPGTLIIKTNERALYQILRNGKANRYLVAVGKEGFSWAGVAKVGMKRENPVWTPPPEMIERKPEYSKWADGMPGGLPINPLGPRAMYLFNKGGDTGFRIHGTIHPESIGTAASSGCIRMLNREVIQLFDQTRIGTKVIVI